jgi:hypothetical protein
MAEKLVRTKYGFHSGRYSEAIANSGPWPGVHNARYGFMNDHGAIQQLKPTISNPRPRPGARKSVASIGKRL